MKILLTGFEPFGAVARNPSEAIVRQLGQRAGEFGELRTAILPTQFEAAERMIGELLVREAPDVLISVGVAPRASGVRLERFARNRDDAKLPDTSGEVREQTPIVEGGPDTFDSTLPLADMLDALQRADLRVDYSDDAGGYVCNHVFYSARHAIWRNALDTRCGFIHVPLPAEYVQDDGEAQTERMSLDELVAAIACCVQIAA